jgi:hypothetical protein
MNRWEREIMFLEEEYDFLVRRLNDLERTEPSTAAGREFRRRLRADIECVNREIKQARRQAELVVIVFVLVWFFLVGGALGAWMAHVRGYEQGLRDGEWQARLKERGL